MTITLGSITLDGDGNSFVEETSARKESILTPLPLYSKDSSETDVFDFGGTMKSISITGIYIGNSITDCKNWIQALEALINGQQDPQSGYPILYSDSARGDIYVKVQDIETTKMKAAPTIVFWSIKLIEASQNA